MEDWYYVCCECSLYSDIKKLEGTESTEMDRNGRYKMGPVLKLKTTFAIFIEFAILVFETRIG